MDEIESQEQQRQAEHRKALHERVSRANLLACLKMNQIQLDEWLIEIASPAGWEATLAWIRIRWPETNNLVASIGTHWTFVHKEIPVSDMDLFLGPITDADHFIQFNETMMADLIVQTGKFPSKGQARKNGWDQPIPPGFSKHQIGKGKNRLDIYVLNLF